MSHFVSGILSPSPLSSGLNGGVVVAVIPDAVVVVPVVVGLSSELDGGDGSGGLTAETSTSSSSLSLSGSSSSTSTLSSCILGEGLDVGGFGCGSSGGGGGYVVAMESVLAYWRSSFCSRSETKEDFSSLSFDS